MAVGAAYTLFGIDISSPASTNFSKISQAGGQPGLSVSSAYPAGLPYPMFTTVRSGSPGIRFTTPKIDTLFDLVLASSGNGYSADLSGGTTTLKYEKVLPYGVRDTSAGVHPVITVNDAMLYWTSITAATGGMATAEVEMAIAYDGTNAPLAYSAGDATGTQTASEEFGLGQVLINGTALDGVRSVTINSGVVVERLGDESEIWPTLVYVRRCAPVATIELLNMAYLSSVATSATGGGTLALDNSNGLEVYFRRKQIAGGNVANATTSHCKIKFTYGMVEQVDFGAQAGSHGRVGLRVHAITTTDTTPPMTPSVGIAHPS